MDSNQNKNPEAAIGANAAFRRPSSFTQHARSIHALFLRNIQTRAGASYLGFLVFCLIPLGHILILLLVYNYWGRRSPIGSSVMAFLVSAILPFIIWSYTHKGILRSMSEMKSLLFFPIIRPIDAFVSAALTEILNCTVITIVVYFSLVFTGNDFFIFSIEKFFFCLVLAYMLGLSTGGIFSTLSSISKPFAMAAFLLIPLYWITSGTLFVPDALPKPVQNILYYFPLSHIVNLSREAVFPEYASDYHDLSYVLFVIIGNMLAFLCMSQLTKNLVSGK